MAIDGNISDLFFNFDMGRARVMENGKFSHFDETNLREEAVWFIGCLERLGVPAPSAGDLVADFLKRV